jgi:hypothetical protein
VAASERAQPKDWLDEVLDERGSCRGCGESYRAENLAVCTRCHDTYCYRCARLGGTAANGNAACRCGGEIVG